MAACTFFGHRDAYGLDREKLLATIEEQIRQGTDVFYVGNQGQFDATVYSCLKQLRFKYPHIHIAVVLAYLPVESRAGEDLTDAMYPEIEGHPKFAVERRNRWMLDHAQQCICYVEHTWGGAYKFAKLAKKRGLSLINLGSAEITDSNERSDRSGISERDLL